MESLVRKNGGFFIDPNPIGRLHGPYPRPLLTVNTFFVKCPFINVTEEIDYSIELM